MHQFEPHLSSFASRANWLRAGVLGANDGIISTAGLVIGVAAATTNLHEIATAGIAGLVSGAVSMALGEYVSVSTQRDTERALIERERREVATMPEAELAELVGLLRKQGINDELAEAVAKDLTQHDVLKAHLSMELGINEAELVNPLAAAGSSAFAFAVGAIAPLVAMLLLPEPVRIALTFVAVLVGLVATGWISAHLGDSPKRAAIVRLLVGGALGMAITFGIGYLFGVATG
jgi:VIT1/CCC1 family predicted Fe2+/Mn2+ transporter